MMHLKRPKKIITLLLACLVFLQISANPVAAKSDGYDQQAENQGGTEEWNDFSTFEFKYADYLAKYKSTDKPADEYRIDAKDYTQIHGMQVQSSDNFKGESGLSVLTGESGWIEWTVQVRQTGLYNLSALYYPVEGKSTDIERAVFIDGSLPYAEAATVKFARQWGNKSQTFQKDNQGDELKPEQIEVPQWSESFARDFNGYYSSPLQFYLSAGTHKIRLLSQKEPMMIRRIRICQEVQVPSYEEICKQYSEKGYKNAAGGTVTVQAEHAYKTSSPTLYPLSDRSSPAIEPSSPGVTRLNSMGGNNWSTAGQWIEWEINAPETGLYRIGMNVKQNWMHGFYVPRKLEIDGSVPFREMEEIPFVYGSGWRQQYLGENDPYLFYFTKGKHLLRMEVVYGKASTIMRDVQTAIKNLNDIYQQVVMLTGEDVDKWRDYQVAQNIPQLTGKIETEYKRLEQVALAIRSLTGSKSDKESIINTVTQQLKVFSDDVEQIPGKEDSFKTNIGSLGTWLTQVQSMPLQLDSISLIPPDGQFPKRNDSFWDNLSFQVQQLINSFIIDYSAVGDVSEKNDPDSITVWVGTGRDQANTIKSLIDETFTKKSGIQVKLMLVDTGTLLQATLAGQGPDVAMQVSDSMPMNFAMRDAAADLTQFNDFKTVASRFRSSAMVPLTFRNKTYALPETQTFKMLFYRKDILKKLGLSVPQTWDEVKADILVLSKNHMEFGMEPFNTPDTSYGMFLYQYGGKFYNDDGKSSALDSPAAVTAFKEWVKYYQQYTLSREFDAQNRFRTGEDPIVIADYTLYNTLQVAAPEISGLWGFSQVPGTTKSDGTVDRSVASSGLASIIMQNSKNKNHAWEFLKWWTSEDVQTKYGREMEAIQGPSARYPTANIEALKQLPWPVNDYNSLSSAFENVKGIPQVPGSYYTGRNIQNAFSTVVIDQTEGAREALMDNVKSLNDEITNKRKEFHLDS